MKDCYITFRSITAAQRGESVLRRSRIDAILQRTPRWMEELGCGYSLGIRREQAGEVSGILKKAGIAYRKIYSQKENGAFEEWNP